MEKFNSVDNNDGTFNIWADSDPMRLLNDKCPNIQCDGNLYESNYYIKCDSCLFEMFIDEFDTLVAKMLGTHEKM